MYRNKIIRAVANGRLNHTDELVTARRRSIVQQRYNHGEICCIYTTKIYLKNIALLPPKKSTFQTYICF
jgi:hypothetical protein